jgi:hypothetical protein
MQPAARPSRSAKPVVRYGDILRAKQANALKRKRERELELEEEAGGGSASASVGTSATPRQVSVPSLVAGCVLQHNNGTLTIFTDKDVVPRWVTEAMEGCRLGQEGV